MTDRISRRAVAGAITALAASVPLAARASPRSDARLIALWAEWQARYKTWIERHDAQDTLWPEWPGWCASQSERDAYDVASRAIRQDARYVAAKRRTEEAWGGVEAVEHEMAVGDAEGPVGLLVRARVLASRMCVNRPDLRCPDNSLLIALRRDLERMAAALGPLPTVNDHVAE